MSSSLSPRVVTAGVPMRTPEVTNGLLGSFGTVVFVQGNVYFIAAVLQLFTGNIHAAQIN